MPKTLHYSLSMLLILLSALVSSGQNSSALPYYDSTWSKSNEPFRIAGNLYYVGTYDLACFLIATPEGHVLINSGLAESVPLIRKSVETLGFRFTDIKILLTTQAHYDHVAGLAEIKKITGAKMFVDEGDKQVLADGGNSDFVFGGKGKTFEPIVAERLLHDGDTLLVGGTKITVLHHPGHTRGSTSFLVDVKDEKRSWKVLIANMPTILSQTRIFGMPSYPGIARDYKNTLESLKKVKFDLWVASHASQFRMHEKRKPGDKYNPEVFADRPGYEASVNSFQLEYNKRLKSEK